MPTLPRSGFHWGDEDSDYHMGIGPVATSSGIGHGPREEEPQIADHPEDPWAQDHH